MKSGFLFPTLILSLFLPDFIEREAVVHFFCPIRRGRTQWNTKTGWGSGKNGEPSIKSPVVF